MKHRGAIVAVFADHHEATDAVARLTAAGFALEDLSVIGRGGVGAEAAIAIHDTGHRMKALGPHGAFWGGLWGLFFVGLFVASPELGIVVVLGYLATTTLALVKSESAVGTVRDLAGVLFDIGFPRERAAQYEAVVKQDRFLVIAHGSAPDLERAKSIMAAAVAETIDMRDPKSSDDTAR
jgi:hypothetical protein